jgi:hypothetical protein
LYLLITYVSTSRLLAKALALKGTPLPDSDIRGDLLQIVSSAQIAQVNNWSGFGYPPLWPTLIGNVAKELDLHVLSIFKPAEFILLAISPFLIFSIWKLCLKPWMALVVTIFISLSTTYNFKNIVLNILIPLIIYMILRAYNLSKTTLSTRIEYLIIGFFIGLASLMYYGYLYWLTPFFITIIVITLFSKKRILFIELQIITYSGVSLTIIPFINQIVDIEIKVVYLLNLTIIIVGLVNFKFKGRYLYGYLGILTILYVLIKILLEFRANDTWFEGALESNDPTLKSIISLNGYNVVIFGLILFLIFKHIDGTDYFIFLFIALSIFLSATFFMYLIASQMDASRKVDLWPRAIEVQNYAINLLFIAIVVFILESTLSKINFSAKNIETSPKILFLFVFTLCIVGSYFVSMLGNQTYSSMPINTFNGAWFAHQGCSNPHEDPMLAKVFENHSDIQNFLRSKCYNVNWPEIPSIR